MIQEKKFTSADELKEYLCERPFFDRRSRVCTFNERNLKVKATPIDTPQLYNYTVIDDNGAFCLQTDAGVFSPDTEYQVKIIEEAQSELEALLSLQWSNIPKSGTFLLLCTKGDLYEIVAYLHR